jgi:hypothetical protein
MLAVFEKLTRRHLDRPDQNIKGDKHDQAGKRPNIFDSDDWLTCSEGYPDA